MTTSRPTPRAGRRYLVHSRTGRILELQAATVDQARQTFTTPAGITYRFTDLVR